MVLVTFLLNSLAGWQQGWVKLQVASGWVSAVVRGARRTWSLLQGWALKSMGSGCKWCTCLTDVPLQSVQLFAAVRSQMLVLHWGNAAARAEPGDLKCPWQICRLHLPHCDKCPGCWVITSNLPFLSDQARFLILKEHSIALLIQNVSALAPVLCR